jgi:hypothetical protein
LKVINKGEKVRDSAKIVKASNNITPSKNIVKLDTSALKNTKNSDEVL